MSTPAPFLNDLQRRAHFERSCLGKDKYPSQSAAEAGIADIRQHKGRDIPKAHLLHAYHCKYCKEWHIGHTTPGGKE